MMYLDANNLYGWAMSQLLREGGFVWLTDKEIADLDILNIIYDASEGYILEADLEYPCSLHECHNDYPLAPERATVNIDLLSSSLRATGRRSALKNCTSLQAGVKPQRQDKVRSD